MTELFDALMLRDAVRRVWGGFRYSCLVCRARMVSRSLPCAESRRLLRLTPEYRALLERMGVSHEQVKAAGAVDFEQRSAHV